MKLIFLALFILALTQGVQISDHKTEKNQENPIKHVILLGMENHSFDIMLGYMPSPIGTLNEETYCNVFLGRKYCTQKGQKYQISDPGHNFFDTNAGIFKTPENYLNLEQTMDGFAYIYGMEGKKPQDVMSSYSPEQVPIISTLAKEFKVFTNWFSSVPTCTDPNKFFYHAASSKGHLGNCGWWYCADYPMEARTIFDNMKEEGISWEIHWQDWNELFGVEPVRYEYENFVYDQDFNKFFKQLENGTLSEYTYLVPRIFWDDIPEGETREQNTQKAPNTQHPSEDIRSGELLIKQVYEALRASDYWENTLLVISYDEAGGFHDHVAPPMDAVNPTPEDEQTPNVFKFERYGVRVPGIVISPWLAAQVDDKVIDHSTISKTLKEIFNMESDYLSERDKVMRPFVTADELLDKPRDDCPMTLPDIPSFEETPIQYETNGELAGTVKSQVYLLGTIMLKQNKMSEAKYLNILDRIKTQVEGKAFLRELQEYLGYIEHSGRQFKYLSRNHEENF